MNNSSLTTMTKYALPFCALLLSSSAMALQKEPSEDVSQYVSTIYHTADQAVSSQAYLPPPPKEDSAEFGADKAAYQQGYKLKGTERWKQAATDADLHPANIAQIFSVPMGITISPQTTPTLYKMLGNLLVASGDYAPKSAKEHYMRKRPFMYFNRHTCQPLAEEDDLRKNGSYPSGHTAYGWTLALMLAEIDPAHASDIFKRGYEFGQSRVICGAHWQSDVHAGRVVGAAEYSYLHTIPQFQADLRKAATEVQQQLKK